MGEETREELEIDINYSCFCFWLLIGFSIVLLLITSYCLYRFFAEAGESHMFLGVACLFVSLGVAGSGAQCGKLIAKAKSAWENNSLENARCHLSQADCIITIDRALSIVRHLFESLGMILRRGP